MELQYRVVTKSARHLKESSASKQGSNMDSLGLKRHSTPVFIFSAQADTPAAATDGIGLIPAHELPSH